MKLKYVVPFDMITQISASSQNDSTFVMHVKLDKERKELSKGDHVFSCDQIIEFITRVYAGVRKMNNTELPVNISDSFQVQFDRKGPTQMEFDKGQTEEVKGLQ